MSLCKYTMMLLSVLFVGTIIAVSADHHETDHCPHFCPRSYRPVCGSDGKTYSNECHLNVAKCHHPELQITKANEGTCSEALDSPPAGNETTCTTVCTSEYMPVCGNDGKTYSNRCNFDLNNCVKSTSVQIAHNGACM